MRRLAPALVTLALGFVLSALLAAWHGISAELFCVIWLVITLLALLAALSGER